MKGSKRFEVFALGNERLDGLASLSLFYSL